MCVVIRHQCCYSITPCNCEYDLFGRRCVPYLMRYCVSYHFISNVTIWTRAVVNRVVVCNLHLVCHCNWRGERFWSSGCSRRRTSDCCCWWQWGFFGYRPASSLNGNVATPCILRRYPPSHHRRSLHPPADQVRHQNINLPVPYTHITCTRSSAAERIPRTVLYIRKIHFI